MLEPRSFEPLDDVSARALATLSTLLMRNASNDDHTLTLDDESITVSKPVFDALREVLDRFGSGNGVVIGSTDALLTTSQAAKLIGISATYLLRLLDTGRIPVEYRGTHRRIRLADATAYLASRNSPTP